MRLKIIEVNFTTKYEWLFKLKDHNDEIYYVMDESFYKKYKIKTPITRQHLDSLEKGQSINAIAREIDNKNIVVQM
ncbi:MAG: hypothetical protein BGO86_07615 [Chryseobacterium sp. 36-9]|uniref:Uncharacterized protein n=1 Tax=Epilithonimonas pallida TaxID=373671 RepID=A0ABY1R6G4_9FLAO|nr:hypothetical protein [Epilithonimonas pallida]OJX28463.1 MAG: hypothetical protein BGO86_07590 [Chryseobacterium sp. 36-9]OJX28468.1 MAG: hypothetical protein BGO86_07615 [Chryseobacterium sp. 36-9]SMP97248.1 hypothetical protein SAMN05421679_1127 [Epilithonimonas pallida]